jgi:hypothetical protein
MSKKKISEAEKLRDKINQLDELEMYSIYQILEKYNVNITNNMNGIYFDLLTLPSNVFKTIKNTVEQYLIRKEMFTNKEEN